MNYYSVTAKCGHVGRGFYIPITFPVWAESGKDAAAEARFFPRVKHHHKDAILDVRCIDLDQYLTLKELNRKDPYLSCKNIQEQRQIEGFSDRLCPESVNPVQSVKESYRQFYDGKKAIRNPRAYFSRMHMPDSEEDWEMIPQFQA